MGSGGWGVGAGKEGVALIVNRLTSFEGCVLICHTKYNNLNFEPKRCGKHLRCLPSVRVPLTSKELITAAPSIDYAIASMPQRVPVKCNKHGYLLKFCESSLPWKETHYHLYITKL